MNIALDARNRHITRMKQTLEETLIDVWRQAFTDGAKSVVLDGEKYSIVRTTKRKLHEVDFQFDGKKIRGLEQNPNTKITVGCDGKTRKESHAVPCRRQIRG